MPDVKWPWVSRREFVWLQNWMLGERKFFEDQAIAQQKRIDTLTERLLSLKMAGAVEVPKPLEPTTVRDLPFHPPDELRELIDAKAGGNLNKRRMMLRQLSADRNAGINDDQIRDAIESGVTSDAVPE